MPRLYKNTAVPKTLPVKRASMEDWKIMLLVFSGFVAVVAVCAVNILSGLRLLDRTVGTNARDFDDTSGHLWWPL